MNPNRKIQAVIIVIIIAISCIFAGLYFTSHFNIDYEIVTDYNISWSMNYSIINEDNDVEVQAYMQNWEDWNLVFNPYLYTYSDWNPDFDNYSYAFLYWGCFPTLSYYINFDRIYFNNGNLEFHFSTSSPDGPDMMAMSMPSQLIQFEKSHIQNHIIKSYEFILDSSD